MRIIEPHVEVVKDDFDRMTRKIEWAGRKCYKSENLITNDSAPGFVKRIIGRGHESVIEHSTITVNFVVDRGISHEIVRHRIASYSQESSRYCRYSNGKFGNQITVIKPFRFKEGTKAYERWFRACSVAEDEYLGLLEEGEPPEWARLALVHSLKTEVVVTYNLREWRHFLKLRADAAAHPQIRQVAIPLLLYFQEILPAFFEDIPYDKEFDPVNYAEIKLVDI